MGGSLLFSRRHPAQLIALLSLVVVGTMYFVQSGFAAGGGDGINLDINVKDGMEKQAVFVGLGILCSFMRLSSLKSFTEHSLRHLVGFLLLSL